jgi:hypothetical protein
MPRADRLDSAARFKGTVVSIGPVRCLHGRCCHATQSPPSSPVSLPHRRCGRSTPAIAATHRSASPCVGPRWVPLKSVIYPTVAAPQSSRVHDAGELLSTSSCAVTLVYPEAHRFTAPRLPRPCLRHLDITDEDLPLASRRRLAVHVPKATVDHGPASHEGERCEWARPVCWLWHGLPLSRAAPLSYPTGAAHWSRLMAFVSFFYFLNIIKSMQTQQFVQVWFELRIL